eukprot:gnl/MRDRNA2_/MRDRNA2_34363_c0_seq1.p1 gnl/MRDRNA2_/MRDRNA2_34363_c0~~gnl/MRDRNA2_/MRDRNA2_34363_c0_seq1.p1  ORF type:complete len:501 (+),score=151.57 gnl/MRDRNA2_/MRDRNA2_34363_c0_seq1:112-1614(+)
MSQTSLVTSLISLIVLEVSGGPSISLEAATALDTDGSGKVELNEIIAFARSHGLDVNAVETEFASFDRDQDGTLDISELNATLGAGDATRPNAEKVTLRTRSQPNANEAASQAERQSPPKAASHAETQTSPQAPSQAETQTPPQSLQNPPQAMIRMHNQNAQASNSVQSVPRPAPPAAISETTAVAQPSQPATNAVSTAQAASAESVTPDVSAAQSMIKALDTDGSGVVEKNEVDAFAKSQGLSAAETAEEFKDLDKNHDGQLDSSEISSTVAQYTSTAAPVPVAAATKPAPAITNRAPVNANVAPAVVKPAPAIPAAPARVATQKTPELPAPPAKKATETESSSESSESSPMLATDPEEIVKTLVQNTAQADRTVAQLFALKASNDLAKRDKDLEEANALEQKAIALRGQAQKVAGDAIESAEQAAQKVGRQIMEKALDEAQNLENQAKKVEGRAASINAKAKVAMSQAIQAQSSASKAVEDLVTSSALDAKENEQEKI